MPATLAVSVAAFAGWSLLLAVVPLALAQSGASDALAGASTGVFMAATVAAQLAAPRLLRAAGYRPVLASGCALLGAPALALLITLDPVPTLIVSAVRGIGFGLLTVTGSALIAELSPARLLARATAAHGIAAAAPQIVALPGGVLLAEYWSLTPVFVLGAAIPLGATLGVAFLPAVHPAPLPMGDRSRMLPMAAMAVPLVAMAVTSAAFGGLSSLLTIATEGTAAAAVLALAVQGLATVAGRYWAGALAARLRPGRLLLPGLAVAALGLALVAVSLGDSVEIVGLQIGALLFGLGFGFCQNDSLVAIFAAAGPQRLGAASAAWNIAFDGGTGVGSFVLGVVAAALGYVWVFGVAAAVVAAAVPITLRAWR
ncbi:MFS transporter [Aldersonia sp. NBC_00410]|uniref:MFS transporter n=1 Tax=Aldersonia sp. NBC_00410 TaxID=2975954 RepID=UPI002259B169|nr:MFS transporter [Aldersonia sp. NBC_00410]MCX5046054.1 MFS transporter [Aldersonia sp. NBC_00410]